MSLALAAILTALATANPSTAPCPAFEITAVRAKAGSDTRPVRWGGRTIQVDRTPIVTLDDIAEARWGDPDSLQAEDLQLKFTPGPAARLDAVTADPKGVRLAVVMNDQVLLNAYFSGGYGVGKDGIQISPGDPDALAGLPETIRRCSAAIVGR